MKPPAWALRLPALLQDFFQQRLQAQQNASPATVASYRDTLRLLAEFVQHRTRRPPSRQRLTDWDAPCLAQFLQHLENHRHNTVATRNARLAAVRSFLRFVGQQEPAAACLVARVLALPEKRYDRPLLGFLSAPELRAVLQAPNRQTASGQRDFWLFTLLYETGARVSELLALDHQDLQLGATPTVQLQGKGRKRRALPLRPATARQVARWLAQTPAAPHTPVFRNRQDQRLSRFGAAHRLQVALRQARARCPALRQRPVSLHTFRNAST
jgi:integrase/recombinase XerD